MRAPGSPDLWSDEPCSTFLLKNPASLLTCTHEHVSIRPYSRPPPPPPGPHPAPPQTTGPPPHLPLPARGHPPPQSIHPADVRPLRQRPLPQRIRSPRHSTRRTTPHCRRCARTPHPRIPLPPPSPLAELASPKPEFSPSVDQTCAHPTRIPDEPEIPAEKPVLCRSPLANRLRATNQSGPPPISPPFCNTPSPTDPQLAFTLHGVTTRCHEPCNHSPSQTTFATHAKAAHNCRTRQNALPHKIGPVFIFCIDFLLEICILMNTDKNCVQWHASPTKIFDNPFTFDLQRRTRHFPVA